MALVAFKKFWQPKARKPTTSAKKSMLAGFINLWKCY